MPSLCTRLATESSDEVGLGRDVRLFGGSLSVGSSPSPTIGVWGR